MRDLFEQVAGCFPRRETRQSAGQMVDGLLMELEDYNCWSIAEAVGHRGPHRLQHLLSRAVWDDQQVLDAAAAWAVLTVPLSGHEIMINGHAHCRRLSSFCGCDTCRSGTVVSVQGLPRSRTKAWTDGGQCDCLETAITVTECSRAPSSSRS
jgi:hypothetical protein